MFKQIYYRIMIIWYRFSGKFVDQACCNSSWTRGHMDQLWGANNAWMRTIYPPCDTDFYTKTIDVNGGIVPAS